MPLATLVRSALPPILQRMMSWRGPHMFLEMPTISMGTGSGSVPEKTVQAVAFMPGRTSASLRICTGPALGRGGASSREQGEGEGREKGGRGEYRFHGSDSSSYPHCTLCPKCKTAKQTQFPAQRIDTIGL